MRCPDLGDDLLPDALSAGLAYPSALFGRQRAR
jgi:hypothetical protein